MLLTFDAYEDVVGNKAVADWLNQQLLMEVETALGLAVIVAGQTVPDFANATWRDLARHIPLELITEFEPWREWVSRRYPAFQEKGGELLTLVKATHGQPLLMASLVEGYVKS